MSTIQEKKSSINCFIDVETTGFDPWSDAVISIGALLVDDSNDQVLGEFYKTAKIETPHQWNEKAFEIHQLQLSELELEPSELTEQFFNFIQSYTNKTCCFISHSNRNFDWNMMRCHFFKTDRYYDFFKLFSYDNKISTLELARKTGLFSKNTLDYLCTHYSIPLEHHNALSDAKALYPLYKELRGFFQSGSKQTNIVREMQSQSHRTSKRSTRKNSIQKALF